MRTSKVGLYITHFCFDFSAAFTGHGDGNNAGFSWSYQRYLRVNNDGPEVIVTYDRVIAIQSTFAGHVSAPMRAVMDDYGTLVVVGPI